MNECIVLWYVSTAAYGGGDSVFMRFGDGCTIFGDETCGYCGEKSGKCPDTRK